MTDFAAAHRGGVPAFHRDRELRWTLDIATDIAGQIVSAVLSPLRSVDKPKRGVVHTVPASTRTVGVSANLAIDDAQYVLGRGDEKSKPERVRQCHEAFVELVCLWADSVDPEVDPVPHVLRRFYRDGWLAKVAEVEELTAKDGVLVSVNGVPAHRSPSVAGFWAERVGASKGSGRRGLCMVCAQTGALANTIPGKVPAGLIPGASNDAALISINEPAFGYDLATQLTHTPICMRCADDITVGLTSLLSSAEHSLSYPGQDTRLAWWTTDTDEPDVMSMVVEPNSTDVREFLAAVNSGKGRFRPDGGRFCWLGVSGQVARILVREWVDMPFADADPAMVSHFGNVAAWFADHELVPRRSKPVTLPDGRSIPAGKPWQGLGRMAACLGRWDATQKRYLPFVPKGVRPNPDRPNHVVRHLLEAAALRRPLPVGMRAHLIHRICSDGRLDDTRMSLIRLGLTRSPHIRSATMTVPKTLDPLCTEPAYLAGRLFAVMENLQYRAHNPPRKNNTDAGDDQLSESGSDRSGVNATFGDRYLRSAVMSPKPALIQGFRLSTAWVAKIRRRDGDAHAIWWDRQLQEVYGQLQEAGGSPLRCNLVQQEWFAMGRYQQRYTAKAQLEN
ncbi:type I-C CRISPR-associated protein Cas8c/Csd1 [Nocardia halotolerans]|uniref:Type I-C CRISPR-associated protein Cas8c/Csd1 n=1 Tax=Nocardia halotolerans TaxID=1755878 RepID=A0ABV8VJU8_9NOCA